MPDQWEHLCFAKSIFFIVVLSPNSEYSTDRDRNTLCNAHPELSPDVHYPYCHRGDPGFLQSHHSPNRVVPLRQIRYLRLLQ